MLFNSAGFLLFLPIVLFVFHACPARWKRLVLLAASYAFYSAWDVRFLSLLIASTLVDFTCARAMPGSSARRRRALLYTSLALNLGLLGVFKYAGFFVAEFSAMLTAFGLSSLDSFALDLLLPIGISFYTFQTIAYTIDVYRGELEPCESFIDYAVFVAYFPQLVAGPIERASRLLPQIRSLTAPTVAMVHSGLTLMLGGFFKKVVLGDALLGPYVDRAFADPTGEKAPFLLLGALFFTLQIYADFSGYSDIARGASRLLGIELMVNFTQPLLSANLTEFWRRWHISLSTWLRDYLYISLGGNRRGTARTYANLLVTMLLGGLWHGASWNFVIWGGLHGVGLAMHRALTRTRVAPRGVGARWAGVLATNALVVVAFVFFRAPDLPGALAYFQGMAPIVTQGESLLLAAIAIALYFALVLAVDLAPRWVGRDEAIEQLPSWARSVVYAAILVCLFAAWPVDHAPFIYFQF